MRSVSFEVDNSHTENPFFPVVVCNEIILRPDGMLRRQHKCDGETLLYVRRGAVRDADSAELSGVLRAGVFATLPTRRGSRSGLMNASSTHQAQVFEIGVSSSQLVGSSYEQSRYSVAERRSSLCVVASFDRRRESLQLAENIVVYSALLLSGQHLVHETFPQRRAWLHVVEGELVVGGVVVSAGNGAHVAGVRGISITALAHVEFLLVEIESDEG
jgi:redox-sensitive bicupin YhaK (pirin superfamily)